MTRTKANKTQTRKRGGRGFDIQKLLGKTGIEFHWPNFFFINFYFILFFNIYFLLIFIFYFLIFIKGLVSSTHILPGMFSSWNKEKLHARRGQRKFSCPGRESNSRPSEYSRSDVLTTEPPGL